MAAAGQVIAWLLGSDPSIRWQVMRDLLGVPERQWRAERGEVEECINGRIVADGPTSGPTSRPLPAG
jgi:hypothetical protein